MADTSSGTPARGWTRSRTLRWIWLAAVTTAALLYLWRRRDGLRDQLSEMDPSRLLIGAASLLLAKFLLGENARLAAHSCGIALSRETAFRLYNLSQLGKYVPGSFLQYVGRAAAYRRRGARMSQIRNALLTESLWVVASAALVGMVLAGPTVIPAAAENLGRGDLTALAILAVIAVAGLVIVQRRWSESFERLARSARPTRRVVAVQLLTWVLLGGSFWAFARAGSVDVALWTAVGLFAGAYAVGFMVLIVPAGLGVRDGILTISLLAVTDAESPAVLAVVLISRIAYVFIELVLVAAQELTPRLTDELAPEIVDADSPAG